MKLQHPGWAAAATHAVAAATHGASPPLTFHQASPRAQYDEFRAALDLKVPALLPLLAREHSTTGRIEIKLGFLVLQREVFRDFEALDSSQLRLLHQPGGS